MERFVPVCNKNLSRRILDSGHIGIMVAGGSQIVGARVTFQGHLFAMPQDEGTIERPVPSNDGTGGGQTGPEPVWPKSDAITLL